MGGIRFFSRLLRIQYNATPLGAFSTINFTGAGVVVVNSGNGLATVTISGAGVSPYEEGSVNPSAQLIGSGSTATASGAAAGGKNNIAGSENSEAFGEDAKTQFVNELAQSSGKLYNTGDCQVSNVVVSNIVTVGLVSKKLYLDGVAETLSLNIPLNTSWGMYIHAHAVCVDGGAVGDFLDQEFVYGFKNEGGVVSMLNGSLGNSTSIGIGGGWAGFSANVSGSFAYVNFIGDDTHTINLIAHVRILQLPIVNSTRLGVGFAVVGSSLVVG